MRKVGRLSGVLLGVLLLAMASASAGARARDAGLPPGPGLSSLPAEARSSILAALARDASDSQLAELTASDGLAGDQLGYSIAMDGDTVVVGAPYADYNQGAVYVFAESVSGWANATQTAKLTATRGEYLGWSVAIRGNTIVAGAPIGGGTGAAFVYVEPATGWTDSTETAGLSIRPGEGGRRDRGDCNPFGVCNLGWSVATNGQMVATGTPQGIGAQGEQYLGAVYVFNEPAAGWKDRIGANCALLATPGVSGLGYSVAISGTTVVAGAPGSTDGSNTAQGAVYVYSSADSGCSIRTQSSRLIASDGEADDLFGSSVSIDGNTIVVGAPQPSTSRAGAAYIYTTTVGDWSNSFQIAKLTSSDGLAGDQLGASVSIQGGLIAAGAPGWSAGSSQGAVYLYTELAGGWQNATETSKLTASDGASSDVFGTAVSVSGSTVAAGASGATVGTNASQGAAYVFGPR